MNHAEKIKKRDESFDKLTDENKELVMALSLELLAGQDREISENKARIEEEDSAG